jgi:D-tyrosyl-tRNA(Tyr) deacylase
MLSRQSLFSSLALTLTLALPFPMRAVIQRVTRASVEVNQVIVGQIDRGLMVLLGVESADSMDDVLWLAGKIARLRIFADESGAMNLSVLDIGGDLLVVSQFTLFASTRKGNRPSFLQAAAPEQANQLYEDFCKQLETEIAKPVRRGIFGAKMQIDLLNDGPVTILMDTKREQ